MKTVFTLLTLSVSVLCAEASTYQLTVTNGTAMPLSPSVIYTTKAFATDREIGAKATSGFVNLCNGGNASSRAQELKPRVISLQKTEGLIMPGETRVVMVPVKNPLVEKIHFETMYGKSRDICGVFSISPKAQTGRDTPVRTGAFLPPVLPSETGDLCREGSSVDCLRTLSPATPVGSVHFFRPYLESVVRFLDERFGSQETDTLIVPTGGGIFYSLKKH